MPRQLQFGWGCSSRIQLSHAYTLQFGTADVLEGWTTLSYLMGQYPHLHFGNMVLSQSFRNPALLAKMAASLQYLSGSRLYLGIGTGWNEDEYHAYGYSFPPPGICAS